MYNEDWKKDANLSEFWELVAIARSDYKAFVDILGKTDRQGLIRFAWLFEELASRLGQEQYLRYTDPNFSEDVLDDLWEEVVGKGQFFYEEVLVHPERIPPDVDYSDPSHRMRYEVSNVFFERYGTEIPPYSYDY